VASRHHGDVDPGRVVSEFGSVGDWSVTVAVLVSVPFAVGLSVSWKLLDWPDARLANVQITCRFVGLAVQVHPSGLTEA
jgi:hypothetical protein